MLFPSTGGALNASYYYYYYREFTIKNNDGNVHKLTNLELICRQLAQADNAPIALIYFVVVSVEVTHKEFDKSAFSPIGWIE